MQIWIAEFASWCLAPVLLWLAVVDIQKHEIPDSATFLVALIGSSIWAAMPKVFLVNLSVAAASTTLLCAIGEVLWRRTGREWLGLGDAKLIGAGTMVVGAGSLWIMLLLASTGGICAQLAGRRSSSEVAVPFGPFLAYAILMTHLIAGPAP